MYEFRRMSEEQRRASVEERVLRGFPKHSPPHPDAPGHFRIVTGTCFEHQHILDEFNRLASFELALLKVIQDLGLECAAWCILPNHYHVVLRVGEMKILSKELGKLHGKTSFEWNRADNTPGRKVWFRCQDRIIRSEAHFFTSLNYVHNNPVKHGYVQKWLEWPYSSIHWYWKEKGRDWLLDLWLRYPVLNYGEKWDL